MKRGPKENLKLKYAVYHFWLLHTDTMSQVDIARHFGFGTRQRISQIVLEMKRRENGKHELDPAPERD